MYIIPVNEGEVIGGLIRVSIKNVAEKLSPGAWSVLRRLEVSGSGERLGLAPSGMGDQGCY